MAAISQTYGQIRDFVTGTAGCVTDSGRIEAYMQACLLEIWTVVCDDPLYADEASVDLVEGDYLVQTDLATITEVRVDYVLDSVPKCRTLQSFKAHAAKQCGCDTSADDTCPHTVCALPSSFVLRGDTIELDTCTDQDITVQVKGFREVDCELFTIGAGDVKIWNVIDLPGQYQRVFGNLVLSKAFAEAKDFASATYWQQIASTGLDSLVTKAEEKLNADAGVRKQRDSAPFEIIRLGSTKACRGCGRGKCCCNPGITQTLFEKVYVDCEGNVIPNDAPDPEFAPTGKGGRLEQVDP